MVVMPELASLVALAMLGTGGGIGLGVVLMVFFWKTKRTSLARWSLVTTAALIGTYSLLWIGSSVASDELVLAPGERKYLCELDCHLAYSVSHVTRSKTSAPGTTWTVTVTTLFDENTISSWRSREAPLWPNPRLIIVKDEDGRVYQPNTEAQPWIRSLRPGESFSFELAFSLPDDVKVPRLLISTGTFVDPFMIGHERAPLHKKIWFSLEPER